MVAGAYGRDCGELLGLVTTTPRLHAHEQTGPDLFTQLEGDHLDEPDDCCDGYDRLADRG